MTTCKNHVVCRSRHTVDPHSEICRGCVINFGKVLSFGYNVCLICINNTVGVSHDGCTTVVCLQCVSDCYYRQIPQFPIFPYPELKEAYFRDTYNPRWNYIMNPRILREFKLRCNEIETDLWERKTIKSYINKCTICDDDNNNIH